MIPATWNELPALIHELDQSEQVLELAYAGRAMPAAEAKEHGLINTVYDTQEQMLSGVLDIAATVASKAPFAMYGCKRMILHARDHTVADTLDYVGLWNAGFFQRNEVSEAIVAAQEKRVGRFSPLPPQPDEDDGDASVVLPWCCRFSRDEVNTQTA